VALKLYRIENNTSVYFQNIKVAEIYQKNNLYKNLLEPN
jgi:hypothetical protein